MTIHLLAFGIAKDIIGQRSLTLNLEEGTSVSILIEILGAQYGKLDHLQQFSIAVNQTIISKSEEIILNNEDEVALLPPVSGG